MGFEDRLLDLLFPTGGAGRGVVLILSLTACAFSYGLNKRIFVSILVSFTSPMEQVGNAYHQSGGGRGQARGRDEGLNSRTLSLMEDYDRMRGMQTVDVESERTEKGYLEIET